MTKQHQYLLLLVTLLAVLRFLWQPIIEWQEVTQSTLQQKKLQLAKMERLLTEANHVSEQNSQTSSLVSEARLFIPATPDIEAFKLGIQDQFDQMAKKHELRVQRYSWFKNAGATNKIRKEVMDIRLSGSVVSLIAFQAEVEQLSELNSIEYINANFRRAKPGKPEWFSGIIRIAVFAETV